MDLKDNNTKKSLYYSIGFIALVIISLSFGKNINLTKKHTIQTNNTSIIDVIKDVDINNLLVEYTIILDDDYLFMSYYNDNDLLIGEKKYQKNTINYIKYKDNIYTYNSLNELTKQPNLKIIEYDTTFTNINNIKKILSLDYSKEDYAYKELDLLELSFSLRDVLKLYNTINNVENIAYEEKELIMDIYYLDEQVKYIELDLTELYNLINDTKYNKVIYKISYQQLEKQDNSELIKSLEKIN